MSYRRYGRKCSGPASNECPKWFRWVDFEAFIEGIIENIAFVGGSDIAAVVVYADKTVIGNREDWLQC